MLDKGGGGGEEGGGGGEEVEGMERRGWRGGRKKYGGRDECYYSED